MRFTGLEKKNMKNDEKYKCKSLKCYVRKNLSKYVFSKKKKSFEKLSSYWSNENDLSLENKMKYQMYPLQI